MCIVLNAFLPAEHKSMVRIVLWIHNFFLISKTCFSPLIFFQAHIRSKNYEKVHESVLCYHKWPWMTMNFFFSYFFLFSILLDFWIKFINSLSKTEKTEWIQGVSMKNSFANYKRKFDTFNRNKAKIPSSPIAATSPLHSKFFNILTLFFISSLIYAQWKFFS